LRAGARVRVQVLAGFVMGAEFCKNHDEPINYTVRVMGQALLFGSIPENCLGLNSFLFWLKVVLQIVILAEILLLWSEEGKI